MSDIIRKKVPVAELMAGLAEEAAELAQAALKLRRVWDQTNPTPTTEEDAINHLYEEIADVNLYLANISINLGSISEIMREKQSRWEKRLEG